MIKETRTTVTEVAGLYADVDGNNTSHTHSDYADIKAKIPPNRYNDSMSIKQTTSNTNSCNSSNDSNIRLKQTTTETTEEKILNNNLDDIFKNGTYKYAPYLKVFDIKIATTTGNYIYATNPTPDIEPDTIPAPTGQKDTIDIILIVVSIVIIFLAFTYIMSV